MRQAILLLTNRSDEFVIDKVNQFIHAESDNTDFYLVFHSLDGNIPKELKKLCNVVVFTSDILYSMGYQPMSDSVVIGNCHFPFLKFYLEHSGYDFYWLIEDDVSFTGDWQFLFNAFTKDNTDFITALVRTYKEDPNWMWWESLCVNDDFDENSLLASFNPICRLSNRAFSIIDKTLQEGWYGHTEVILPTIINNNGLTIKDMGGEDSPYGYTERKKLFYTRQTHSHAPLEIQEYLPNTIYHPFKRKISPSTLKRYCVISAVGKDSCHREWLKGANVRNFDLHLIVYDFSYGRYYNDAEFLSYKRGFKLKLVYDYLIHNPNYLEQYDYFFFPDDDITTNAHEIGLLFKYMEKEHLEIAQPSLVDSYFSYRHTLREHHCKIRFTNFVEMMMPCFSKKALKKVLATFNASERGWGVEFHWPLLINTNHRDMAILDSVSMRHTRPVQSWNIQNKIDMDKYIKENRLNTEIIEYDCIPMETTNVSHEEFMIKRKERTRDIEKLLQIANALIYKVNRGEINKIGLDGKTGVALILYLLANITEQRPCMDNAILLINLVRRELKEKSLNKTFNSSTQDIVFIIALISQKQNILVSTNENGKSSCYFDKDSTKKKIQTIIELMYKKSSANHRKCRSEINFLFYSAWNILEKDMTVL